MPSPPFFRGEETRAALSASSHLITQEPADSLIERFHSTGAVIRSHSFDRGLVDALLAQPGAEGIRIHYGKNADGTEALVVNAIEANGQDMTGLVGTSDGAP